MDADRTELDRLLLRVDPYANAHLKRLEEQLKSEEREPPSGDSILIWLNPVSLGDRAEHVFGAGARKWELARNLFTLAPLILTWISLAFATANFATMIGEGRITSDRSFLELWEAGFDGAVSLPVMKFSHVAYLDALLLAMIAVLTFVQYIVAQRATNRSRRLRQLLELRVQELVIDVESKRSIRQRDQLREAFSSAFGSMGDALKAILSDTEAQRERLSVLSERREGELTTLAEVASNMKDGTETLVEHASSMRAMSASFGTTAARLRATAGELVELRSDLQASLASFTTHTAEWTDGIVESWDRSQVEQIDRLSGEFGKALDDLTRRLQTDITTPLLTSPVLQTGAKRIEQLNGAVGRLDAIMEDVHRDAAVLGASLSGLARTFGGDAMEAKVVIGEPDGAWLEGVDSRR